MYVVIADFFLVPFFFGFAVWSVGYALTKKEFVAGYSIEKTDHFITRAVVFLGIMYILFFGINTVIHGFDFERAFGEYWFGFWMYPITYFGITQLLWFKAIQKQKVIRIVLAVWIMLVIQFEKLIIIVTSIYRDFLSDEKHWLPLLGYFVLNMVISFSIFVTLVISGLEIQAWIRNRK